VADFYEHGLGAVKYRVLRSGLDYLTELWSVANWFKHRAENSGSVKGRKFLE